MNRFKLEDLGSLAHIHGWDLIDLQDNIKMVSYKKDDTRLNIYYGTGTVATCLDHPKKGKTQLFRKGLNLASIEKVFENPRQHTGKGYY